MLKVEVKDKSTRKKTNMKIVIVGVGAVGGYFGGRLAQTAHEVTFIARGEHLNAIRENGLRVDSLNGDFIAVPTYATDSPSEADEMDVIVVATKAWQIPSVTESMRPMIGEDTIIVPLLNGVEAPHQLATVYGYERVLGGFCRVQSRKAGAGHIIQGGTPPYVSIGAINTDDTQQSANVQRITAVFTEASIEVQLPDSIEAAMWQKLLFVSAFGGVGAVTRMPAGVIRSLPEVRAMLKGAMTESYTVALAQNIPMADDAVATGMAMVDRLPEHSTASMQRDIMNGYPSELDAQNGAVVRIGEQFNITTSIHRFIYHSLLASEKKARGELTVPTL